MQKRANRILSALLVLVMVLSMLPATVFATGETANALKGWNIILGDDIGVKFTLNSADYTVITTVNGAEVTPTISGETVTVNVAAAQMTDTIGLTVKNGEETVHTGEYSVREYADIILAGNYDAQVKDMVKQMLNYGAAAQTYFNYNAEDLANTGITVDEAAVPTEVPAIAVEDNLAGISLYGMSMVFRSKIAVRFYFNVTGDINSFSFSQGTPVEKDGLYYVEVAGINPQDLDKDITLSVNDGALSVTYSPMTYIVRQYNSEKSAAALKTLVQAMYGYHLEAKAYSSIIWAGTMNAHASNGYNANALYFSMAANAAPNVNYRPTAESNIKLIRDGVTYTVGHTLRDAITKASNDQYYFNFWVLDTYKPVVANDVLIIEGNFVNADSGIVMNISKSYILFHGDGTASFSTEMPTLPTTIDAGTINAHASNGYNANALYFSMAANDAPNVNYRPTAESNIKLIRNGETYVVGHTLRDAITKASNDQYYFNFWVLDTYKPVVANDILVIEGGFTNADSKVTLNIAKSYILFHGDGTAEFSTEMPTLATVIDAGVMSAHSTNGWNADALYFSMAENVAPVGDAIRYKPETASNIKLIRDGQTYDVGHNARETIVKSSETGYYIALWTLGDYKPLKANDILIVEGDFTNAANNTTLNISKSYILINADGTASFSTEMPKLPTTVEGGAMMQVDGYGWTGGTGALIFKMNNTAPNGGYKPASASNIKLLRDGQTYDVAYVGQNVINKSNDGWYTVEFWTIVNYKPLLANDILVIEGDFYNSAEDVTMNITKTYVLLNADGSATFSAEMPSLETVVDCGVMSKHAEGNASDIYFTLAENSIPVDEEASYPYTGTVQLVSSSNTSTVNASIIKLDADMYYLELDVAELSNGSYLIVEGAFSNADNGYTMNISKTYVLADGDSLVYSETEPVLAAEYALTGLTNHPNGWTADGIYIAHNAHNATSGSWSDLYRPVSSDVIKLVRNGETFNIGQPAGDTLVAYNSTNLYFVTAAWTTVGGKLPFVDGDKIIIEGKFQQKNGSDILVVEKTVICVDGSNLVFNPIEAGNLDNHSNGMNSNGEGIYATMAPNAAPAGVEYAPMSADAYYVIRGEEIINIGMLNRGTLVKYNDTQYYLKIKAWCTNNFAYTTDDIIVIDGYWKQNTGGNAVMKIEKTYLYHDGSKWVFSATEPVPTVQGGMMQAYGENKWHSTDKDNAGNLWFALDDNNASTGAYKPTAASNVKLIRDGVTYDVGHTGRDTINKINNGWYTLEFWTIADHKPMLANDILIVEGDFYQESSDTTLNITKTYVLLNADGSASFSDTEPVIGPEITHGLMNVTNWQKPAFNPDGSANDGGLYFTMAENDVAYNGWSISYTPVAAENIKLIRGGVETNVANTGVGMIIKYSATDYYLQFWPITQKPMQAGDIMIVEGKFKNDSNGSVLNITKTYIVFNENGTVSVYDNSPMVIDAGVIGAYTQGWFNNGFFFTMEANNAPAGSLDENNGGDWTVEYTPSSAAVIKLVRDGVATEIAMVDRGTITKLTDTVYYFRIDDWATPYINNKANLRDGDMLVVEGEFYGKPENAGKGYTLNISKSYIIFTSMEDEIITFSTGAETEFGDVVLPSSNKTLNIGMWNGSYHIFTNDRLAELQAAGITKIMGIDPQWTGVEYGGLAGLLDRAAAYNIDVIVDLRGWDGTANYAWTNSDGEAVCYLQDVVNHPALMGFIMFDEPSTSKFDELAELKAKFDALKREGVIPEDKLFFVNLYGSSAAASALGITYLIENYETHYVQKFLDKLGVEVLSWDSYPLVEADGMRTGYFQNFEIMASKGAPLWYTMLSSGHNTTVTHYETPTAEDLRWQMAVAMTYGVQNIDHYIYASHEKDYSCMYDLNTGAVTDLYYDIKDVNNEYLAWDNIYMAYNWVGVGKYSANNNDAMLDALTKCVNLANYGVRGVSANENLLIGVFDHTGSKAYMVTNAGSTTNRTVGDGKKYSAQDATVTLTLDAADYKCAAIIDNGEISYVAVNNNTVTLTVEAYEGVFVIPVLN